MKKKQEGCVQGKKREVTRKRKERQKYRKICDSEKEKLLRMQRI